MKLAARNIEWRSSEGPPLSVPPERGQSRFDMLIGITMAKTDFKSVDDYIASFPEDVQQVLQRVRSAIRKAVPAAEEMISYQIAAYKLLGGPVLYFAGWKKHYSLYPASVRLKATFQEELKTYEINKSTIRFPLYEPVPVKLIEKMGKFRAKEVAERDR